MSGVYPSNHSVGVRHCSLSRAVWFLAKHVYSSASSPVYAGALLEFNVYSMAYLLSLQSRSAKFVFLFYSSLVLSLICSISRICSTLRLIWALALSLMIWSMAPYLRIWFSHQCNRVSSVTLTQTFYCTETGLPSDKDLCCRRSIVNCRTSWPIYSVSGNWFVPPRHIEGWIRCFVRTLP